MITKLIEEYLANEPDRVLIREMNGKEYTIRQMNEDISNFVAKLENMMNDCNGRIFGIAMRSSYE